MTIVFQVLGVIFAGVIIFTIGFYFGSQSTLTIEKVEDDDV